MTAKSSLTEDTHVDSSMVSTTAIIVPGCTSPLKCTPPVISNLISKEDYDSSATVSIAYNSYFSFELELDFSWY